MSITLYEFQLAALPKLKGSVLGNVCCLLQTCNQCINVPLRQTPVVLQKYYIVMV